MTPEKFVKAIKKEKEDQLKRYLDPSGKTKVGELITSLGLNDTQTIIMNKIVNTVMTDSYYNLLLGLDGVADIGGNQENYELKDEEGNLLTGQIEGIAYKLFQENN